MRSTSWARCMRPWAAERSSQLRDRFDHHVGARRAQYQLRSSGIVSGFRGRLRDAPGDARMTTKLQQALERANPIVFTVFAGLAGFVAYFCMYAFRKPFS